MNMAWLSLFSLFWWGGEKLARKIERVSGTFESISSARGSEPHQRFWMIFQKCEARSCCRSTEGKEGKKFVGFFNPTENVIACLQPNKKLVSTVSRIQNGG